MIVSEIATKIPLLRFEALLYMAAPLRAQGKHNPEIAAILERFASISQWQEALNDLGEN
jgi:hypothetical protein